MSLPKTSADIGRLRIEFDYQSECHCSKTMNEYNYGVGAFDYQSECHCSKTVFSRCSAVMAFDYQSECHCSKT